MFSDTVEFVVRPAKGRPHALRVIRDLLAFAPRGRGTNLAEALRYAARLLRHRSIVAVLSDFRAEGWEEPLARLASRHDVVAITVDDASTTIGALSGRSKKPTMSSSAAGVCNVICAVQAIAQGQVPPTMHLRTPDPQCDLDFVPRQARAFRVKAALSNSFGFGGHNVTLAAKAVS